MKNLGLTKESPNFHNLLKEGAIVAITDVTGKIIFANDRFCQISKYRRDELVGQNHRIVNSKYHPVEFFQDLWKTIASGKVWKGEICNRAKDGSLYWVDTTIIPILNEFKEPERYVSIRYDITLRKQLELEVFRKSLQLKENAQYLEKEKLVHAECFDYVNASSILLKLAARANSITEYLDTVVKLLNEWTECCCLGIRIFEEGHVVCHSYQGFQPQFWESENKLCLFKGSFFKLVCDSQLEEAVGIWQKTHKGSFYCSECGPKHLVNGFLSFAIIPVQYKEVIIVIYAADHKPGKVCSKKLEFIEDISPLIAEAVSKLRLGEKIKMAQEELNHCRRLSDLGTVAAIVAHELRNPLAVISMAAQNVKQRNMGPVIDKKMENIEKNVIESNHIINNLLNYTKVRTLQYGQVNITIVIKECVELALERYQSKNVKVSMDLGRSEILIEADLVQIKEVVNNVINNAFEAFEDAEEAGDAEVNITLRNNYESIEIGIKDNGIGMGPEQLERIKKPFFTTKNKGTGLGLSVCYQIIEMHKGRIDIKSEKDKGTQIKIILPVKHLEPALA